MANTPPGWHPDPSDASGATYRWWDGTQWTAQTQPAAVAGAPLQQPNPQTWDQPPAFGQQPQQPPAWGQPSWGQPQPAQNWARNNGFAQRSFGRSNQASLTAVGVSVLYVIVAFTAHIVFLGILPAMMTFRAFQRKEALAPLAVVATVIAVALAFIAFR